MSAISTETLSLGYGETVIIDELDVAIPKGEITVLIGSNGCGKSTLLRSLPADETEGRFCAFRRKSHR